jgi:hypothetical protein
MNIFIGTSEIASVLTELAEGFKELGHNVTTYVTEVNKFYEKNNYDIKRNLFLNDQFNYKSKKWIPSRIKNEIEKIDLKFKSIYLKIKNKKLIENNDLFIFIWEPWIEESLLFPLIKSKGKKIICIQLGSDVRYLEAFSYEFNIDISSFPEHYKGNFEQKIKKIRAQELYADVIYSVPDQASLMLKDYKHIYIPISQNKNIRFNIPKRKIPLIVHAPSNSDIKGTNVILKIIQQLKNNGVNFEFKLIQNMQNDQLINVLSDADILCDELYFHGPGVLSTEAMLAGCAVLTRTIKTDFFNPPVVSINENNLYDELKNLIENIELRSQLAILGREFALINNNSVSITSKMIEDLTIINKNEYYKPNFYLNNQKLFEKQLTSSLKMLDKLVIDNISSTK